MPPPSRSRPRADAPGKNANARPRRRTIPSAPIVNSTPTFRLARSSGGTRTGSFPKEPEDDPVLASLENPRGIAAYAGITTGEPEDENEIDILVAFRNPVQTPESVERIVRLFATRIALNLKRYRAEAGLRESETLFSRYGPELHFRHSHSPRRSVRVREFPVPRNSFTARRAACSGAAFRTSWTTRPGTTSVTA